MADRNVTINGVAASWADVAFSVSLNSGASVDIVDISGLDWARGVEVGEQRGRGGVLRATTRGQATYEASATFYESGWDQLEDALAAVNADNMSLVFFSIRGLWTPPGSTRINQVEIVGSRIINDSQSNQEGVDPTKREVTFKPTKIRTNGRMLLGG